MREERILILSKNVGCEVKVGVHQLVKKKKVHVQRILFSQKKSENLPQFQLRQHEYNCRERAKK